LEIVAIDDGDIGFTGKCLCGAQTTKACAKDYNFGQL
jgi:hypothetical protein